MEPNAELGIRFVWCLFEPLSVDRTEVTVKLRSTIEPATLAQLKLEYLTNFKQFVEGQMLL
jgi:hypothetical protein